MRLILRIATALIIGFLTTGCNKGNLRYTGDSSSDGNGGGLATTGTPALDILSNNCAACHGQPTGGSGGINDILNVNHMIETGMMVPGSADTSPLLQEVEAGVMPPTGPLPAADVAILRKWIDDGMVVSGPAPTPQPLPPLTASYQSIFANIQPKCLGCHNSTISNKGVRFDSFDQTIKEVDLAMPAKSNIYKMTRSAVMPPSPTQPLSTAELAALLQWIQDGAINN